MKDYSKLKIFLFLISFIQIYSIEPLNETNKLIPYLKINSTISTSIPTFKNGDNLYFSFDFDNFNKFNLLTYFLITTEKQNTDLSKSITHSFIDKDAEQTSYTDILENEKKLKWYNSKLLYKHSNKLNQNFYFIHITREIADNKKKSLIIKIPILQKTGKIIIQHIPTSNLPNTITKVISSSNKDNSNDLNKKRETRNNTYVNNNNNKNYPSYDNKKNDYDNNDYYHNEKSSIKYNRNRNKGLIFFIGSVLTFIWTALLILYCLVNRRKNTFNVTLKNIENNYNSNGYMNI